MTLAIQDISGDFWIGARKAVKKGPYEQLYGAPSFNDQSSMWEDKQPAEHAKKNDMCSVIKTIKSAIDDTGCTGKKPFICHVKPIDEN